MLMYIFDDKQKTVSLQNIDTQIARFKMGCRPARSHFDIFFQSTDRDNKKNIAPGMHGRLIVCYKCDGLSEPEEKLMIHVLNGKSIIVNIRSLRSPPILRVLSRPHSSSSCGSILSHSNIQIKNLKTPKPKTLITKSNIYSQLNCLIENYSRLLHWNINCKKCFVGEILIIKTILKNTGGKGRFFMMSEFDWCSMKIEDFTITNKLIVPPFTFWPSYFILQPDEPLVLYTYFYPGSYGLQTDQLYIISDNCSLKTIEVFGDSIMFEPYLLQINQCYVKCQWYRTKSDKFITIRYLDLGSGRSNDNLMIAFTVTSTCDLDLRYRWEINNNQIYPTEYTNLFSRKNFCTSQISIKPSDGTFQANSITSFKLLAYLSNAVPGLYRANLQLIIEDLPFDAVSTKHEFSFQDSKSKQRLCGNPIDIIFQNIEVRLKCISSSIQEVNTDSDRMEFEIQDYVFLSFLDITKYQEDTFLHSFNTLEKCTDDTYDLQNEITCQYQLGFGKCDCCYVTRNKVAVLRPGSPLFIGIQAEFSIIIKNDSSKQLMCWWDNYSGEDRAKITVSFEQKYNVLLPYSSKIVKLSLLPTETGTVSSLYVDCKLNNKSDITLSIECIIQSLCISFYFPSNSEENELLSNEFRIEWNSNDYISKWEMNTNQIKFFPEKLKKEKFLFSTILNTNSTDLLNKDPPLAAKSVSLNEMYSPYRFTCTSKNHDSKGKKDSIGFINTINDLDLLEDNWEFFENTDEGQELQLVPYFNFYHEFIKQQFRYLPLILEVYIVSGQSARKRIFIDNESPIASSFYISIKNFSKKTTIVNQEDQLDEFTSGVTLTVEPLKGIINSNETVYFDIIANSNTWGTYIDRITVNINLLPAYSFWIRIINKNSPIFYPIYKNPTKIPKIRFDVFESIRVLKKRKLLIKNTSTIPLYLHWHCFSINENVKEKPFNIILDIFSPFINVQEYLSINKDFLEEIKKFFSCAFNPDALKDNLMDSNTYERSSISNSTTRTNLMFKINDNMSNATCESRFNTESSVLTNNTNELSENIADIKIKDTELQLSLVPYYGEIINDLFTITPKELFLPPKKKRYIYISLNSERLNKDGEKRKLFKACGFIRIPPIFKFNDNMFLREDGYYLPPSEVYLECNIEDPSLLVQSSKCQRTFNFHEKDFLQYYKSELKVERNILLKNDTEESIVATFKIRDPFEVISVITERETCSNNSGCVAPLENIEIQLNCTLSIKWMENDIEYNNAKKEKLPFVTLKKILSIQYQEGITQSLAVYIKIAFSTLKVSVVDLNFEESRVGYTKTLTFNIQNLSDRSQYFEVKSNDKKSPFWIFPKKSLLSSQSVIRTNTSQVIVRFSPKQQGIFEERIGIISEIDGLICNCSLKGSALE